ncbi:COX11 [Candida oxycetoniae]|uniref:COX11 n=1 Tax=Candida oxycetoniae TaxID=497107 RepID=A0AAI9SUJ8_9ASCO|nr:COX11 [Candida oxycetoniae]KAI3403165.2 COX11 [Candida oxycetoniae]
MIGSRLPPLVVRRRLLNVAKTCRIVPSVGPVTVPVAVPSMTMFSRLLIRQFNNSSRVSQNHSQPLSEKEKLAEERKRIDKITKDREEKQEYKNRTATFYATSLGIVFLALAFSAVPIYRAICQRTGWGGIPITDSARFTPDKLVPVDTNKRIRVQFTCQSSGILPWKFTPLQREVYVVPGETALAFYRAKNMSKEDVIGMATYSITPENAAAYFNKIQCFCFEEQRLSAGEEVDMPVFFFIDPDFAKDPGMRNIDDIVLHYSFFKAAYADGELALSPVGTGEVKATITA